ncbi:hypothetical protein VAA_03093 [Vibrio anguillarum 775]|nr:hypothetical protein VAA_03093 [Vibrio anguillarum 775]
MYAVLLTYGSLFFRFHRIQPFISTYFRNNALVTLHLYRY